MPTEDTQKAGFFDYIAQNEGLRLKPYKDIKGFGTIGYGHLIKKGEQFTSITKKRAKELFDQDLKHAISVVKDDIGEMHWGMLPDEVQIALADMAFRTDWQKSPTAKGHFKNEDYFASAKEYLDSDEYRKSKAEGTGIAPRMERNANIIVNLGNARQDAMSYTEAVEDRLRLEELQRDPQHPANVQRRKRKK